MGTLLEVEQELEKEHMTPRRVLMDHGERAVNIVKIIISTLIVLLALRLLFGKTLFDSLNIFDGLGSVALRIQKIFGFFTGCIALGISAFMLTEVPKLLNQGKDRKYNKQREDRINTLKKKAEALCLELASEKLKVNGTEKFFYETPYILGSMKVKRGLYHSVDGEVFGLGIAYSEVNGEVFFVLFDTEANFVNKRLKVRDDNVNQMDATIYDEGMYNPTKEFKVYMALE